MARFFFVNERRVMQAPGLVADMKKKYMALGAVVLLVGVITAGAGFKSYAGKSIRFFLDSGFRAPFAAEVIESESHHIGRDGEWIYVFAADDETIRSYLSRTPWTDCQWQKGPVPDGVVGLTGEMRPYVRYLSDEGVWYMYQRPIRPLHDDGRLMIVDAPAKRVYFLFWWW